MQSLERKDALEDNYADFHEDTHEDNLESTYGNNYYGTREEIHGKTIKDNFADVLRTYTKDCIMKINQDYMKILFSRKDIIRVFQR